MRPLESCHQPAGFCMYLVIGCLLRFAWRIRVDQELEHLTDGPLPAYGFLERQVGLDLVAVATASVLHGWR